MKRRSDALDGQRAMRGGALLWQAWRDGREIDALPADCRPRTIEEAYAVQDGLAASAGMAVAGYKIGATNARVVYVPDELTASVAVVGPVGKWSGAERLSTCPQGFGRSRRSGSRGLPG